MGERALQVTNVRSKKWSVRGERPTLRAPRDNSEPPSLVEWNEGWEIQETDLGGISVFHRHQTRSAVAYLWTDADGGTQARCSICHERLVFSGSRT
jgi:hypothetical protein